MNKYSLVALSVIGGILTGFAWTSWCTGLILLVSLVPFFIIEFQIYENPGKYGPNSCFTYTLPGFVIFSILAIGWMRFASVTAAIAVIMGLSFLMAFSFWLAHIVKLRAGKTVGNIALITFWLGFEFLSLNVNIITPWLNLGNGLAKDILFIQWYEVTGTGGGSLWILCSNLLLALFLMSPHNRTRRRRFLLSGWIMIVLIPSLISITRYFTIKQNNTKGSEVVIVQPNRDPYSEKYIVPFETQLNDVIAMAETEATGNTLWIITPETIVDDPVDLNNPDSNKYVLMIKKVAAKYPGSSIVAGLVSFKTYPLSDQPPTISARKTETEGLYYDHFNSAFRIDTGKIIEVYHKSKLVPGIEMQFSTGPGRLIAKILPNLGGTSWGYGVQKERTVFEHPGKGQIIAPVICYESVFGSYVAGYIRNGAQAIFIITNDGWWKNTNGYKQHLSYASVRAIETRRQVLRAANTGISCIIDIKGNILKESEWWTKDVIKGEIYSEYRITTYVKQGDYLLRIASFISIITIIIIFIGIPIKKIIR